MGGHAAHEASDRRSFICVDPGGMESDAEKVKRLEQQVAALQAELEKERDYSCEL